MDKTIKQLADEYGVSKQAIRKRINQLPTSYHYVGTNRTIYVTEEGAKILASKVSTNYQPVDTNVDTKVDTLIETLTAQLKVKDEQIERLQQSLNQAQQLQAIAEQKIKLLEQKQEEPPIEQPKKKWWLVPILLIPLVIIVIYCLTFLWL